LSAIRVATEIISRLPQGRLDQETTFNLATINGGTVRNAVPETTELTGEFRSSNEESLEAVRLQLEQAVEAARQMFPEAGIEVESRTQFHSYRLTDDDPALKRVKAALESLGLQPTMKASGGGSDANVFRLKGISAVVVGMATRNMHTVREEVRIPELVQAALLCETLLRP
jgi:tripeptide aminopeptidase